MNRKKTGDRIRQCRTERRLSMKELAERTGLPEKVLSQLEEGAHKITTRMLVRIARAMRVRLWHFLD